LRRTGLLAGEGCLIVGAGGLASRISSLAVGALGALIRLDTPLPKSAMALSCAASSSRCPQPSSAPGRWFRERTSWWRIPRW